jgi:nucleotidyltransferase/DNA polymerase involved in DNA repair
VVLLTLLHVDLDEFIAAVEMRRRPELRGRPVVVGGNGDPSARGVVATASYAARRFGVGSGMPLRLAARKCPDAIFLPMDRAAYETASARVMEALRTIAAELEVAGWDEAFLATNDDPRAVARRVQDVVRAATGLECSVGIGDNKLQAKTASGFAKPAGVFRLSGSTWPTEMGHRPVDHLWGIGRKRAGRLAELGIATVGDLAAADVALLERAFGASTGRWLQETARGEDRSLLRSHPRAPRSRGREKTFQKDLSDRAVVEAEIVQLARTVAEDLIEGAAKSARVVVKVRWAPFFTQSRGVTLERATADPDDLARAALAAFAVQYESRPIRLVGVRCDVVEWNR